MEVWVLDLIHGIGFPNSCFGQTLSAYRYKGIFCRPQRDRLGRLSFMVLKQPALWCLTPRTIGLWQEMFIQSCFFRFRQHEFIFRYFCILSGDFSEYLWYVLIKGICWQVSSKIARFPSAGPLFRSVMDSSTSLLVITGFLDVFSDLRLCTRGEIDGWTTLHPTDRWAETSVPDSPLSCLLQTLWKNGN